MLMKVLVDRSSGDKYCNRLICQQATINNINNNKGESQMHRENNTHEELLQTNNEDIEF